MCTREDDLNDARIEGKAAALLGLDPQQVCPYPPGSGEWRWFQRQYDATRAEMGLRKV
jgi:hypothetical protein